MSDHSILTVANAKENVFDGTRDPAARRDLMTEAGDVVAGTDHCIEMMPVSRLTVYKGNARTHSKRQSGTSPTVSSASGSTTRS